MTVGERGGTVHSVDEARELQEERKPHWSALIRQSILDTLEATGAWHADDLIALDIPADCKNIVGAQTNALLRQGIMAETGVRRSTSDPAGHGRRSAVYRITELGRQKLKPEPRAGVSDSHPSVADPSSEAPALFELAEPEPVKGQSHYESEAA